MITNKDELLVELKKCVLQTINSGNIYIDLSREQFASVIKEHKLNSEQAMTWLLETNLFVTGGRADGWMAPSIRQEVFDRNSNRM